MNNQDSLREARLHIASFEEEQEPERLREAYMALEGVMLQEETKPVVYSQLRAACLATWLQLLQILDQHLDPAFDPNESFPMKVMPPLASDGSPYPPYPPGVDPALIDDPIKRAAYKRAITDNLAKQEKYRLQIQFLRLNEALPPRVDAFIRSAYMPVPKDQQELSAAFHKMIQNKERKAALLRLLSPEISR